MLLLTSVTHFRARLASHWPLMLTSSLEQRAIRRQTVFSTRTEGEQSSFQQSATCRRKRGVPCDRDSIVSMGPSLQELIARDVNLPIQRYRIAQLSRCEL